MFSHIRTIWLTFLHLFKKKVTIEYPEEKVKLHPRWRGRIVLTKDPDGGERCVGCYLCSAACPVDCIDMPTLFYIASVVAVIATLMAITRYQPIHALLYLVVSFLAVAMIFLSLGAPFVAALEIILYAGAIIVLLIFVVMMLNLGSETA